MAQLKELSSICSLIFVSLFISGVVSTNFTITNNCNYTVWPGISNTGSSPQFSSTGLVLQKGESKTFTAPTGWGGRVWGRTYCSQNSTGNFSCLTGDCGSGKVECLGNNGVSPQTLAEFQL
ncbi:PR5-like receptor kinase [Euphorbia lathyris]|uniref:PR5-like receptor kinase n=1 Tax=Euphorbia lathyris TaxID=212925 RepID=UPI003313A9A4